MRYLLDTHSFLRVLLNRLQITDYRLQTTDYRLQITDYRLQITDYRLQITDYRLQTTDYDFKKGNSSDQEYVLEYHLICGQLACYFKKLVIKFRYDKR